MRRRNRKFAQLFAIPVVTLGCLGYPTITGAAEAWPAEAGTQIGQNLGSTMEPSGVAWQSDLERLVVVGDEGEVVLMTEAGVVEATWVPGGDLEAVTVADPTSHLVYLGVEHPDAVAEFDLDTGTLTGRIWTLTDWLVGADNLGLEALTFVPNGSHPYAAAESGGLFYAGLQADGSVSVFDLDLSTSEAVSLVDVFTPVEGRTDLADLHFQEETGELFAVYDADNILSLMDAAGVVASEYLLPGFDQEGMTLVPACPAASTTLFIAEDSGVSVQRYAGFPLNCPPSPEPEEDPAPPADDTATDDTLIQESCSEYGSLEIRNDNQDNDCDGRVDEFNTKKRNGPHPTYAGYDPTKKRLYARTVRKITGGPRGTIKVHYADHSAYRYRIFESQSQRLTRVTSPHDNGWLRVYSVRGKLKVVNAYNGRVR